MRIVVFQPGHVGPQYGAEPDPAQEIGADHIAGPVRAKVDPRRADQDEKDYAHREAQSAHPCIAGLDISQVGQETKEGDVGEHMP